MLWTWPWLWPRPATRRRGAGCGGGRPPGGGAPRPPGLVAAAGAAFAARPPRRRAEILRRVASAGCQRPTAASRLRVAVLDFFGRGVRRGLAAWPRGRQRTRGRRGGDATAPSAGARTSIGGRGGGGGPRSGTRRTIRGSSGSGAARRDACGSPEADGARTAERDAGAVDVGATALHAASGGSGVRLVGRAELPPSSLGRPQPSRGRPSGRPAAASPQRTPSTRNAKTGRNTRDAESRAPAPIGLATHATVLATRRGHATRGGSGSASPAEHGATAQAVARAPSSLGQSRSA